MSPREVRLVPVDESVLTALLAVAVAEAEPGEVMAPVPGPPGWTTARRDAFAAYHRSGRAGGAAWPAPEITYAVEVDGLVVGALRLAAVADVARDHGDSADRALEVGLWLGRAHRGRGIGRAAVAAAATTATRLGARRLVARTSTTNTAALAVLAELGYDIDAGSPDGAVTAVLALGAGQVTRRPRGDRDT